jgi:hypothetical protein
MKGTVVTIALGLSALGVVACGGSRVEPLDNHPDVEFTLVDVGGVCTKNVSLPPESRKNAEHLKWKITNKCAEDVTVSLRDFTHQDPKNSDVNPFDQYDSVFIAQGKTRTLNAKVKDKAINDTYHFHFYLDERQQADPDIVIDN